MKAFLYKVKGAVALALAMSMFCPQVFAVEALSAAEQGVQGVQEGPAVEVTAAEILKEATPVLGFDEALKRALKHSPSLADLEDLSDYLSEKEDDLLLRYDELDMPRYEYRKWVDSLDYSIANAAYSMEYNKRAAALNKELLKLVTEASVRSCFITILSAEDTVELSEESTAMKKTLYEQGFTKYRLGMLSKFNLDQLQRDYETAKNQLAMDKASLEQAYMKLNDIIGARTEERFQLVYDIAYVPYELSLPMEQYINVKMKEDLTIKQAEMTEDNAKFNNNYLPIGGIGLTGAKLDRDQLEMTYDQAKRALRTNKVEKELAIRNAYLQIQQLESTIATMQESLAAAQAGYRVAQINYQAGNVTKLSVQQAGYGVAQLESALEQMIYNHEMLVFTFENTSLLSSSAQ